MKMKSDSGFQIRCFTNF